MTATAKSPALYARFFSLVATFMMAMAVVAMGWTPDARFFAAMFLMFGILFYLWSAHFAARQQHLELLAALTAQPGYGIQQ